MKNQLLKPVFIFLLVLFVANAPFAYAQSASTEQLVKKAKDHFNLFQFDQALSALNQAVQINPNDWEAHFLIGRALMRQKKELEAEKHLQKALELNRSETEVQKALGALYISFAKNSQNAGKHQEMVDFLHKACRAYPSGTKIWQSLMENWWKMNEFEKIKQEGDFIVKNTGHILEQRDDKSLQTALVYVARAFFRENDLVNAGKFIKSADMIRQHNDDLTELKREIRNKSEEAVKKLVDEANAAFNKGDYDKALELLQIARETPGAKKTEITDQIERTEREAGLMKALKEADSLINTEKFEEALEKLEEASLAYPEDDRIKVKIENIRGKVDKIKAEEARKRAAIIAEKKRKLDQKAQFDFFIKEGQDHEKSGNFDIAILSFENALKIANQPAVHKKIEELKLKSADAKARRNAFAVSKAELEKLFNASDYNDAFSKASQILADHPENKVEIARLQAEICLNLGKFSEAKEMLISFENDSEHEHLYNYIKGMIHYREGERDEALTLLTRVNDLKPGFRADINSTIWWIYLYKFQMGIYIVLLMLMFPAVKFSKEMLADLKVKRQLAKIEKIKETSAYEENLAFLEERYEKDDTPNPKQIAVMLAEAYLRTSNPQKAYEISNNLLKKDSRNANARRIAGEACLQLSDTSPAGLEYIQGLLKIDGTRKPVINFLARTYMQNKADHKMAQDYISEYISINPGDTEAIAYLADTYIKRQTYNQQSIKVIEKAIRVAPEVPDYYQAIIENFRKIDNPSEAQKWLEVAREKFPQEEAFSENPVARTRHSSRPAGALPDYENIGRDPADYYSTPATIPDYESIGNDNQQPQESPTAGGFPDYDSIGLDDQPADIQPPPAAVEAISGPTKLCQHCQKVNSTKEYYCTGCGKPFI